MAKIYAKLTEDEIYDVMCYCHTHMISYNIAYVPAQSMYAEQTKEITMDFSGRDNLCAEFLLLYTNDTIQWTTNKMPDRDTPKEFILTTAKGAFNEYSFRAALPSLKVSQVQLVESFDTGYTVKISDISRNDIARIIMIHDHWLEIV